MRLATRSVIWIVVAATTQGAIDVSPFHVQHWFADGIAVGEVVSVAERTVDFKIEQWVSRSNAGGPTQHPSVPVYGVILHSKEPRVL